MTSNENRSEGLERLASIAHNITFSKLCSAVSYGAAANIYKPVTITAMELSSPQCLLLAFLNSLVTGDVMSCILLASVSQQVQQLRSKYLKVWLTEDFVFPRQDMEKAIALLTELVSTGVMALPSHVAGIISSLAIKYGIAVPQIASLPEEDDDNLAIKIENAVSNNSPGDIITLITAGGDVNALTQSGDHLLHFAARTGSCASIAVLGFLKADLEIVNSSMATPLEVAVRSNNVASVRALLMAGAKIDKHLLRGDTYLHIAAAGGHNRVLSVLLEGGLEKNLKNHFDETPLFQAVRAGNVLGVEILLEKGADVNIVPEGSKNLIEIAVESQNVEMFKAFMKTETLPAHPLKNGDSILHFVAKSGNVGMLKVLKDRRLPPNIKNLWGTTPLHVASNISIVNILLGMGLDIDAKDNNGCTALMIAAKNSKPEISSFLLHSGANPNIKDTKNMTPLHYAAGGGDIEIVKALLEIGARIEEKNIKGKTPAFIAAVNNKLNALELLVEHGADLSIKDNNGECMIHHAAREGYSEIVSVLIGSGVMVDMKASGDRTALHYAAEKGHVPVVSVLLNRGADVRAMTNIINEGASFPSSQSNNFPPESSNIFGKVSPGYTPFGTVPQYTNVPRSSDMFGVPRSSDIFGSSVNKNIPQVVIENWTPLIAASKVGSVDVVKLLVDEGAPVNDRDSVQKWTALGWAVNKKHKAVADYLRSVGGTE